MHELSITQSILKISLEAASQQGATPIRAIRLRMGPFSGVVPECVQMYLDVLAKGTRAEGAKIEVETVPLKVLCRDCGRESEITRERIQCPFCLEEDAKKLDYFTTENEPGYQVHVCRSCKSYIKIADFREFFGRESIPALDDLESLPLDIAAQNEDFHRVAPSEWGL